MLNEKFQFKASTWNRWPTIKVLLSTHYTLESLKFSAAQIRRIKFKNQIYKIIYYSTHVISPVKPFKCNGCLTKTIGYFFGSKPRALKQIINIQTNKTIPLTSPLATHLAHYFNNLCLTQFLCPDCDQDTGPYI